MSPDPNPPGSPEAVDMGCTCPVLDNRHGTGCGLMNEKGEPLFWFKFDCPIHGEAEPISEGAPIFRVPVEATGGTKP